MFAGSVPTTFSGLMARTCCWLRSRSSAGPTKLLVDQTLFTSWHISLQYVTHWQTYPLIPLCVYPRFKAGSVQFSSSVMFDFATSRTTTLQASLSFTNSWSLLKAMSIESVMPSNHLILCHALLLLPSIFPSIRVFFSESVLLIRWPKYWSFSFSISPSNEYSGLMSFRSNGFDLIAVHRQF